MKSLVIEMIARYVVQWLIVTGRLSIGGHDATTGLLIRRFMDHFEKDLNA